MWKALEEMEQLGWVQPSNQNGHPERSAAGAESKDLRFKRPKMIAIQASGCAPVARAYKEGANASQMFENAATFAAGLRVPKPYGDYIILDILEKSGGKAIASDDATILASILDYARNEGIFLSPEGAAATAAYDQLLKTGELKPTDKVVLFNTGAGLKYTDMTAEAMRLRRPNEKKATLPTSLPVGGIITPQ